MVISLTRSLAISTILSQERQLKESCKLLRGLLRLREHFSVSISLEDTFTFAHVTFNREASHGRIGYYRTARLKLADCMLTSVNI